MCIVNCVWLVFSLSAVTFLIYHERNTSSNVLLSGVGTATKSGSLLKCFLSLTVLPIQFPQNRCFPWPEVCFPQHWSFDSIGLIKTLEMYLLLAAGNKRLVRDESHTFIAYSLIFRFSFYVRLIRDFTMFPLDSFVNIRREGSLLEKFSLWNLAKAHYIPNRWWCPS